MVIYYWIWGIVTAGTLAWCSLVTVYVAFKGVADIRQMLRKLGGGESAVSAPVEKNQPIL